MTERTHEIGLRAAPSADRGDVLRLVLGEAVALAAAGAGIGRVDPIVAVRHE